MGDRSITPDGAMNLDEQTKDIGRQILNLIRHENISGLIVRAKRIETEAPELGIRLESEGGSLYLRFGDDRFQIRRPGPRLGVRYVGEFGSEIGGRLGRPQPVLIEMDTISRLAAYIDRL
jgi:hypothetical protein